MDIAAVKARVPIQSVIGRFVELRMRGHEYTGLCPFHDERTPSFTVRPEEGRFHCFGCGADGDVFDFVIKIGAAPDIPSVVDYLGQRDIAEAGAKECARNRRVAEIQKERQDKDAETTRREAYDLWKRARPAGETMVEHYLRRRGYTRALSPTVRFAPELYCHEVRECLPGMVAAIVDAQGVFRAIHRTWLARGRDHVVRKAELQAPKKVLGRYSGGAIRLWPMPWTNTGGLTLYVGEGIETSYSIVEGLHRRPERLAKAAVWAGVSLTNMSRLHLPLAENGIDQAFSRIVLMMDADMKDGARAKTEEMLARARWEDRGIAVRAVYPPEGTDLNDVLTKAPAEVAPALKGACGPTVAAVLEAFPGATVVSIDGKKLDQGETSL